MKIIFVVMMCLILCVSANAIVNVPPILGTVSPASGGITIGQWVTVTCTYSDANGAGNLASCSLLINNSIVNLGGAHFFYDQNANKFYMKNNAGGVIGGFAPYSANTIQSENATLNCQASSVTLSVNTITVAWRIMLKPTMAKKTCGLYMTAKDDLGASVGWTSKGQIYANSTPTLGSVSPCAGSVAVSQWKVFTCVYSDVDGAANLSTCSLLANVTLANAGGGHFFYDENQNKLYMKNNAGTVIGGYAPGSANTIQSENASLDCAGTTVLKSGNNLTVNWRVTLKPTLNKKTCNLYMMATDDRAASVAWTSKGQIYISAGNSNPVAQSVSPASGSVTIDQWKVFTCVYSDADGAANLATCGLLINNLLAASGGGYLYFDENQNKLYMKNNAGVLIGGYAPGSANSIQSENARLDCAGTTVAKSGNNLTVNWRVMFYIPMAGKTCNLYMSATDDNAGSVAWVSKGSVSVVSDVNHSPVAVGVSPNSGTATIGLWYAFTCLYSDADGANNLAGCDLLVASSLADAVNGFFCYDEDQNKLYMVNNSYEIIGGYVPGAASTIESESAILDCAGTVVTKSGNDLFITWVLSFKSQMAGKACNLYMYASDASGATQDWVSKGTIKIVSGGTFYNYLGCSIYANDGTYLGTVNNNKYDAMSIANPFGTYGNKFMPYSILNSFGLYGSAYQFQSPFNSYTSTPPVLYKNGVALAYLTTNQMLSPRVDTNALLNWLGIVH